MPSVTFDPGVLAPPSQEAGSEHVRQYFATLKEWRDLLDDDLIDVYMSERASEVLCENGIIPLFDTVKELIKTSGLDEYSVDEIVGLAHKLLRLTPSLEDRFGVRDVWAEDVVAEPDLLSVHSLPALSEELRRCALLLAMLRGCRLGPVTNHALVVQAWNGAALVSVRGLIQLVECQRNVDADVQANSDCCVGRFEGSLLACRGLRQFILALDEVAIWQVARDDSDLALALRVAIFRTRASAGIETDWETLPVFYLGSEFSTKARSSCSTREHSFVQKLLRAMVETVEHSSLADSHSLRTQPGGASRDRTMDRCRAMRRDIDREYHLHYWEGDNEKVEFASVGPHNDFSIPEPSSISCSGR